MGDEDFEEMRKVIHRMLRDAFEGRASPERPAFVRGFLSRTRAKEEPPPPARRVVVHTPPQPVPPAPDVGADGKYVFVTIDLGNRAAVDVRPRVSGRLLRVLVTGPAPLEHVVELPCRVRPEVQWTLRNGVIDLVLVRANGGTGLG